MAKRPQQFWAALWIAEGGSPGKADLASAVVMAESGGDETVDTNPCCKGGYQINVEVGNTSRACAMNAVCSTRWSIKESKNGKDWGAWEAYTNGSYRKYLGGSHVPSRNGGSAPIRTKAQAKSVLASFGGDIQKAGEAAIDPLTLIPGVPDALPSLSNPLDALGEIGDIIKFFKNAGELLLTEQGWVRVGKMVGGSIFLLWGLRVLVNQSTGVDPVKVAQKTASKAAETAATVAVVK